MNKKFKRICAAILTLCVLGSATTAFAEWRHAGYDLNSPDFAIQYQEFDEKGLWTGRMVKGAAAEAEGLKGFPTTVEYKDSYPNATYYCAFPNAIHDASTPAHFCGHENLTALYLDGNKVLTNWATGLKAGVEEKWENLYFEKAAPHKIVQKMYTNLPGKGWTTSANHPRRYSGINEIVTVKAEQVYVDIDYIIGNTVKTVIEPGNSNNVHNFCYEKTALDARVIDATGFATAFNFVPKLYQKRLVGSIVPVEVVDNTTYTYGLYSKDEVAEAKWIVAGYEAAYPYREYAVLSLDGYVMDGGFVTIEGDDISVNPDLVDVKVQKPYIFKYTGGFGHPNAQ